MRRHWWVLSIHWHADQLSKKVMHGLTPLEHCSWHKCNNRSVPVLPYTSLILKEPPDNLSCICIILIIVSLNNGRHRFLLIQFEYQSILRLFRSFFWTDSILIYYLLHNSETSSSGEIQNCLVMRCVFFWCCTNKVCSWSPVL